VLRAPGIAALVARFAAEGVMLPRSAKSIALALGDFIVAADARGRVLGCGALREYSPSLAEIASLAVAREAHGGGIGAAVVRALEGLARLRGTRELFALTLVPAFFEGLGYVVVDRAQYPEKTRRDCLACARRGACREICVRRCLPEAPHAFVV
jgi:amino-acid N-acetyltransferase